MRIQCPHCPAVYELDDSRVPPSGLSIKCPKCKNPFTVHRQKGDAATAGTKGAVPLPGQAGGPPVMTKAPTAARPPTKSGGAVPLPGLADGPRPPSSAPALPDLDLPGPPGAAALPGLDEGGSSDHTEIDFWPPPAANSADDTPPLP